MTLDKILKEIKKAEKIAIFTHETPDGDAIGSALALKLALKELKKSTDVVIPTYSKVFEFLPAIQETVREPIQEKYDLAIAVDCGNIKRLAGNENGVYEKSVVKINIDHHSSNSMFGDYNFINPVSPACCEIIIGMLEYFEIKITQDIATCIAVGMITDTGGFQYSNVTAETFEFAAELMRKGVNISDICKKTLDTKTKANFELSKIVSNRMEFFEDGKISFSYITVADEKAVNAEEGDHEGLVNIGRSVEGVEVSIFIREREKENANGYKISLRSNSYVNVSDVAMMFGGGGHIKAAGAFLQGDVDYVKSKILAEVKKVI